MSGSFGGWINKNSPIPRMLDHKEAIISHLSWASLFLGFHTLGLYVHNDVMLAFGTPEKQILIKPIFAQWIQSAHGKTSYGFDVLLIRNERVGLALTVKRRLPSQHLDPALPKVFWFTPTFPTCPTVAEQFLDIKRTSPEGNFNVADFSSFAISFATAPAALAN
ncbi:hypothetical protein HN873_009999 [Arachis hypogaea]